MYINSLPIGLQRRFQRKGWMEDLEDLEESLKAITHKPIESTSDNPNVAVHYDTLDA